ncbi:glycosyl transferase family 90 [Paracoccus sp. S-4012]|uniref:glycosyl transferase family 90 n=1 Tax=Paracoccus sp. S-4012 TaxID=2665648 RepID=UPI0018A1C731|nr:glycosyl transferase family 90 [Paracoccus sp. S-4012]
MKPLALYVGLPQTGEDRLATLFEINGLSTTGHSGGRLAQEVVFRRLSGSPLGRLFEGYDLIVGLEGKPRPGRPFLTGYTELEYLLQCAANAVLVFNDIDQDIWIRSMQLRDNGAAAAFQATWLGVPHEELPAIWCAQFAKQRARVETAQDSGARVVVLDADGSFSDWQDRLSPWFDLPIVPDGETVSTLSASSVRKDRVIPPDGSPITALERTTALARHCLGSVHPASTGGAVFSDIYAEWDGGEKVTRQDGTPFPVRFGQLEGRHGCLAQPGVKKANRVEGVINEALSSGAASPLRIDMQDCRLYGLKHGDIPDAPVLTYCRRGGAKNVVLWPLPEYHSIGAENFVGAGPCDNVSFEDKLDVLFWRGALSGHCSNVVEGVFTDEVWRVADALSTNPECEDLWELFATCTRVSVLERHGAVAGIDMKLVSGPSFEWLSKHPRTASLCGRGTKRRGTLRHRYILSMRGYDTGSNFISAANSNSVVLKEEDGWELFYSPLFRPWESYIPLAPGLHDLEERLEWARSNPARCKEISAAARDACRYLASPKWRRLLLRAVAGSI